MKEFGEPKVDMVEYSENDFIVTSGEGCSLPAMQNIGQNCGGGTQVSCLDGVSDWQ